MFIHFAFGQFGKQGKIIEQTEEVISKILTEKRLVARNCTEFLPAFPVRGKSLPLGLPAKVTKDDEGHPTVWFKIGDGGKDRQVNDIEITFLPSDVAMICFINTSFNSLRVSPHPKEYGKFGLVFNTPFLKSNGLRPVSYYSEESLWHDPAIIAWNNAAHRKETNLKAIQDNILAYRKPDEITSSRYKYDRYPVGYNFRDEHEHRIVFQTEADYLQFKEDDVYMIIVPNSYAKEEISSFVKNNWKRTPLIQIFPD
jgi:hypothetical protein